MEYEEGSVVGQCKEFVQQVIADLGGTLAAGYGRATYVDESGGIEVTGAQAIRGDIIQISHDTDPEGNLSRVHTAIVLENNGDGTFDVVHSNWCIPATCETRSTLDNWNPTEWASEEPGFSAHYYRLGSVGLYVTSFWSKTEQSVGPWVKGLGDEFDAAFRIKNNSDEIIEIDKLRLSIQREGHETVELEEKDTFNNDEETLVVSPGSTWRFNEVTVKLEELSGPGKDYRVVAEAYYDADGPGGESSKYYEVGRQSLEIPEFSVELFTPNRKDSDEIWWFGRDDIVAVSALIQNNGADPANLDELQMTLHDADDNYLKRFKIPGTTTDKVEPNIVLNPGYEEKYPFTTAELNLVDVVMGDYFIVLKYRQGEDWHNIAVQRVKIPILTSKIFGNDSPGPWLFIPADQELRARYVVRNNSDINSALIKERAIVLQKMDGTEVCEVCEFKKPGDSDGYQEDDEVALAPGEEYDFPKSDAGFREVTLDLNSTPPGLYRVAARVHYNGNTINIGSSLLTLTHFTGTLQDANGGSGPWTLKTTDPDLRLSYEIQNATTEEVIVNKLRLDVIDRRGRISQAFERSYEISVSTTLSFPDVYISTSTFEPGPYQVIASMFYDPDGNGTSEKYELITQTLTVTEDSTNPEPIPVESLPHETDGTIQPKETISWELNLTEATTFKAEVSWPGSDLDLIITTPSGKTLTPGSPEVLDSYEGPTSEYYVIKATEIGDWTIAVYADDVEADGEDYTLTITETTALGLPIFSSADFASLQAAINTVFSKGGGIIEVEPGVYRENIVLKNNVYLIATNPNPANTIIQGVKDNRDVVKCEAQNSAIFGFTIKGKNKEKGKGKGSQGNAAGINVIGGTKKPLIANCIILNNQHGIIIQGNSSPLILNNTIVQNTQTGIITNGNAPTVILNNIVVENGIGIQAQSKKAIKTLNYNNVWGNSTNYVGIQSGANSISVNPSFAGFFQLKAGSPCKNAGRDYLNSGPIDLGAYVELDWQQICINYLGL
ncbi:right-handed parallel beta-helix repeat-containing protein [Acidobacteriota bacterium]